MGKSIDMKVTLAGARGLPIPKMVSRQGFEPWTY